MFATPLFEPRNQNKPWQVHKHRHHLLVKELMVQSLHRPKLSEIETSLPSTPYSVDKSRLKHGSTIALTETHSPAGSRLAGVLGRLLRTDCDKRTDRHARRGGYAPATGPCPTHWPPD